MSARRVVERIAALPQWRRARRVGLYLACDGELDVGGLAALGWQQERRVYLPVVGARGEMRFARWRPREPLKRNRYGIPEPRVARRHHLPAICLDVLVMPLVAFDRRGRRLGMGGGYFDRALARAGSRPLRVGVGFDVQEVDEVPEEPWDVPLALIVTDRRVLRPRRQAGRSLA